MKQVHLTRPTRKATSLVLSGPEERNSKPQKRGTEYTPSTSRGDIYSARFQNQENENEESPSSLDRILASARKLNTTDRKQLLANLALEASSSEPGSDRDVDMWTEAVHGAIDAVNGRMGEATPGPLVVKRLLRVPAAWGPVADFMQHSKLAGLTVSERQSVYTLLAQLVVNQARRVCHRLNVPLSPKFVANCAQSTAAIFDTAFPGYLASGLALIVAKQLTSPKH